MREFWTSLASLMGVLAFCQTLLSIIFPPELRFAALRLLARLSTYFSSYCYFDILEIDGVNTNELYNSVQLYLSSSSSSASAGRLSLTRATNSSSITYGLSNSDTLLDTFNGVTVHWEHIVTQRHSHTLSWRPMPDEKRGFTLRVPENRRTFILDSYLDHITERAAEIRRKNQDRYLYTNPRGGSLDSRGHPWEAVPFKHPSTFETLAMDPVKKAEIMDDLRDFADGETFYNKTGRAWKRGYLLYGPPGTGKSSMIAAMANYLGYDIYDLELTEVASNSELRKLLMKTTSKSIIVIEDIDCSLNLSDRRKGGGGGGSSVSAARRNNMQYYGIDPHCTFPADMRSGGGGGTEDGGRNSVTLSGLLNFTDGLWSCCGCERIFVFTTNHIDKLDPALLRSGRMDMHIFMSYCRMPALKILLRNYLGLGEGDVEESLMWEMGGVIEDAGMTPADISEVLIRNRNDKARAVSEVLEELKRRAGRKRENKSGSGANDGSMEEEEEQEKRALEIHRVGSEEEIMADSCMEAKDLEEKDT